MTDPAMNRRDAMLEELLVELERTRRTRNARKRAWRVGGAAFVILGVVGLAMLGRIASSPTSIQHVGQSSSSVERVTITRITTTTGIADAITVRTSQGITQIVNAQPPMGRVTIERLDDRGLSQALAEMGCDPAVIRIGDQVIVKCPAIKQIGGS